MTNPLLDFSDLPLFDRILPEHVAPAVDDLLVKADAALEQVTVPQFPATWGDIARVLDVATENLGRAWGAVSHLNSVADAPELRAAYNAALPRVTEFWTRLGADERLYAKYKAIDVASLNTEQRQAHKNAIRNFVLSGAELPGAAKERFASIQERQAELSQKFSENALDATDAFAYYATADEVVGVPEDVLQTARAQAEAEGKSGYRLSLKMPSYLPVMQFAESSALRETLYKAYTTRASEQAPAEFSQFDNSAVISEILSLRLEEAQLLGYRNFGEVSVVAKMAQSPEEVITFLRDLARRARPYAEKDIADLRAFAAEKLMQPNPQPWDYAYIGEKLKEARYAFSEQEVKQYFTAPKVLAGLFKIVENLFEVEIRPDSAPVWKPGVAFYRIERNGQLMGQLTSPPEPANAAAPGWTMSAPAGYGLIQACCKHPWHIWSAISPKA
jgi:oligopeptidase A